jgi:glycosyltransferase involved in cell wall biosynthesis
VAYRIYQKLIQIVHPLKSRMAAAGCDVWLVPFAGIRSHLTGPQVLVIFDLVFRHVPEIYTLSQRKFFERVFALRAKEATLIYCGSHFVKAHDLIPCYPFAADRIRIFPLAPPMDFQHGAGIVDLSTLRSKYKIGNRFLFYPAALRAHKNHAVLIRALKLLRKQNGLADLELVLTGEGQNADLIRFVAMEGLEGHVHFLGTLSRGEILALYQHALVVPLPSLHEGYGLPLLEALQNECPVACADIPAFLELLEGHIDAVQFFDPRDPVSIADAIWMTIARRDEFRDRQSQAYRKIARRDWHAVAQDFLRIFEETRRLATRRQETLLSNSPTPTETRDPSLAA